MQSFYSHGKLLLTAEYLVLDGAIALAIPTKKGQSLSISKKDSSTLVWKSFLADGTTWIDHSFPLPLEATYDTNDSIIRQLHNILHEAQKLNPNFLNNSQGHEAISALEFPRDWGLGSSSTLITNIASWAKVNPYTLLANTFGGSGYDIACAKAISPITYAIKEKEPLSQSIGFIPPFSNQLFFVHLNKKQNSRESIAQYKNVNKTLLPEAIREINSLTKRIINCEHIVSFEMLITQHEQCLAKLLNVQTVKQRLFTDYPRAIKSLGGWGGDFILVTGTKEEVSYFKKKGYTTIIGYQDMIFSS